MMHAINVLEKPVSHELLQRMDAYSARPTMCRSVRFICATIR